VVPGFDEWFASQEERTTQMKRRLLAAAGIAALITLGGCEPSTPTKKADWWVTTPDGWWVINSYDFDKKEDIPAHCRPAGQYEGGDSPNAYALWLKSKGVSNFSIVNNDPEVKIIHSYSGGRQTWLYTSVFFRGEAACQSALSRGHKGGDVQLICVDGKPLHDIFGALKQYCSSQS
jgi:hypothetical protein